MSFIINSGRFAAPVDGYLNLPGASGDLADTPDHADFDILADIDIQVELVMTDWTPAATSGVLTKFNTTGNQRAWGLQVVATTGVLRLNWSTNGTTSLNTDSTVATGFADGSRGWIRVTMDVNDGASNRVTKFYTSPSGASPSWTQLGTTVTTVGTTSIANTTALPQLGAFNSANPLAGKVYRAKLYNGYDGAGTLKASPDFTANAGGTTYTDPEGHVWTVRGSATLVAAA